MGAVSWIQRWQDWYDIVSRPGLLRDRRVLPRLAEAIKGLKEYPTYEEFRELVKVLSSSFPTRQMRNSFLLSDDFVRDSIDEAVKPLLGSGRVNH